MSIPELQVKARLLDQLLRLALKEKNSKAARFLEMQHRDIMRALVKEIGKKRVASGEPPPPAVVVRMKPARIKGRAPKIGNQDLRERIRSRDDGRG
jgi:hypothetical protein